jgi:hypothetical protein
LHATFGYSISKAFKRQFIVRLLLQTVTAANRFGENRAVHRLIFLSTFWGIVQFSQYVEVAQHLVRINFTCGCVFPALRYGCCLGNFMAHECLGDEDYVMDDDPVHLSEQ